MLKMMTIKEVAESLRVHQNTIYKRVRAGEMPSTKVGSIYRVSEQDLEQYLQDQRVNVK